MSIIIHGEDVPKNCNQCKFFVPCLNLWRPIEEVPQTRLNRPEWCPIEEYEEDDKVNDMKPCPFCGGRPIMRHVSYYATWIACCDCGAMGPPSESDEEAAKKWNKRYFQAVDLIRKKEPLVAYYDKEETIKNVNVQILTNTKTGETSIEWFRSDNTPVDLGDLSYEI